MKALIALCLTGLAALAIMAASFPDRPAPVAATSAPQEGPAAPERRQLLRLETHAALRANAERWDALAAEARCRASGKRAAAGECD